MEYTIHFMDDGREVRVMRGTTLLDACIMAKLPVDAPCGGQGSCGKCICMVRGQGEPDWRETRMCRTPVEQDLEVRLPGGSSRIRVLTEEAEDGCIVWDPMVRAVKLAVPPCAKGDSTSDWERLVTGLEVAGFPVRETSLAVCAGLGRLLAECRGEVWAVVCDGRVLEVRADEPQMYMAAFDLGTTSIAGSLIHVNGQAIPVTEGAGNPQVRFGADVISRANRALTDGVEALSECVRVALDELTGQMCSRADVSKEQVYAVSLAGNTAMHHLFLGIAPDSLGKAPYNPTVRGPLSLRAVDYGIHVHPQAQLLVLPVIGGFVGADTVACLISGDWLNRDRLTLMIDIGTNGELVLGNRERRIACSTAAGPAFEGAKITCGMRGTDGAIDHVWLEDGSVHWHVIGEGAARGLCGSGLVDLVAVLLERGDIDASGRLIGAERYGIGDTGVYLTQKDIREVQLAKAAMAAGLRLMAGCLGVEVEQIEEVDIAGAFGNTINPDSACAIGLLPACLRQAIVPVGNAAGAGARLALTNTGAWSRAAELALGTVFLELATLPEFQDEFVEQLHFGEEEE